MATLAVFGGMTKVAVALLAARGQGYKTFFFINDAW
jgi:hypothetical protein